MKPKLPLNNLNTFTTAAELSSFQAAAESLHVTPSAVSHQIRNLEGLLGYELFERLDKRVRLTPRGERFFADLQMPFRELHRATEHALQCYNKNGLSLSVAPAFATRWLLPRLDGFYVQHPEINLSLTATSDLVNFQRDSVDAAIRLGNGDWPGTVAVKLFDMQLVTVCLPAFLEKQGGMLIPEQLAQVPLVINTSIEGAWESWFASAGVSLSQPLRGMSVQNASQTLEAIQTGEMVGLIDRPFIEKELASGQLALTSEHSHDGGRAYYLVISKDSLNKPSLQSFRDWLLKLC